MKYWRWAGIVALLSIQVFGVAVASQDALEESRLGGGVEETKGARGATVAGDGHRPERKVAVDVKRRAADTALQRELQEIAETAGFGYKTANLIKLKGLCDGFNEGRPLKVQVPAFVGISSPCVQAALAALDSDAFDVQAEWRRVVGGGIVDEATGNFKPAFPAQRAAFEAALAAAFDRLIAQAGRDARLVTLFGDERGQFGQPSDDLLSAVRERGQRLMVRSTGKEDTLELANAGGNTSVANVEPTAAVVLQAIKTVVLSYFGEKSLTQRLGLRDTSLNDSNVLMPVLLQEMVGEVVGEEIPRCGVMFTRDPESKAAGISVIQAAYGHNEAVVNSLVSVDTYYVATQAEGIYDIYPIIRTKSKRLVPDREAGKLKESSNDPTLARASALSKDEVETLKAFGETLERFYGYPLDVEFVIKGGVIYVVQARPLVDKETTVAPSYIENLVSVQKVACETIGAAGGAVRVIERAEEVLIVSTLGAALTAYLEMGKEKKDQIKVVLVGAMAPSTSHEATTFRGEDKATVYVSDLPAVQGALSAGKKLLVDVQQNVIAMVARDVSHEGLLRSGWVSYPMPRALSLDHRLLGVPKDVLASQLRALGQHLKKDAERLEAAKDERAIAHIISLMKTGTADQVKKAALLFLHHMHTMQRKVQENSAADADIQRQRRAVEQIAAVLCMRLIRSATDDNTFSMERLLPIKALEALLYQQNISGLQQGYSLAALSHMVDQEFESARKQPDYAPTRKNIMVQLSKAESYIFSKDVAVRWQKFINALAQHKTTHGLKALATFVGMLGKHELVPAWLQTVFAKESKTFGEGDLTASRVSEQIQRWLRAFDAQGDFLTVLAEKRALAQGVTFANFEDPTKFDTAWKQFKEQLADFYTGEDFIGRLKHALRGGQELASMAACQSMRAFVDTFDQAIKAMKGSVSFGLAKKLAVFKQMLEANFAMLQAWVNLLDEMDWRGPLFVPEGLVDQINTKRAYFSMMQRILDKDFINDDLQPTPGVDAAVFAMGSGHDFEMDSEFNQQPESAEDLFTIMHQSLLNCCGVFTMQSGGNEVERPLLLEQVEGVFKGGYLRDGRNAAKLIGVDVSKSGIVLHYNKIFGSHSCQINIDYKAKKQVVDIQLHLCGGLDIERYRWAQGAALTTAIALGKPKGVEPYVQRLSIHELVVTISILASNQVYVCESMWTNLCYLALNDGYYVSYAEYGITAAMIAELAEASLQKLVDRFGQHGKEAVDEFNAILISDGLKKVHKKDVVECFELLSAGNREKNTLERILLVTKNFPLEGLGANGEAILWVLKIYNILVDSEGVRDASQDPLIKETTMTIVIDAVLHGIAAEDHTIRQEALILLEKLASRSYLDSRGVRVKIPLDERYVVTLLQHVFDALKDRDGVDDEITQRALKSLEGIVSEALRRDERAPAIVSHIIKLALTYASDASGNEVKKCALMLLKKIVLCDLLYDDDDIERLSMFIMDAIASTDENSLTQAVLELCEAFVLHRYLRDSDIDRVRAIIFTYVNGEDDNVRGAALKICSALVRSGYINSQDHVFEIMVIAADVVDAADINGSEVAKVAKSVFEELVTHYYRYRTRRESPTLVETAANYVSRADPISKIKGINFLRYLASYSYDTGRQDWERGERYECYLDLERDWSIFRDLALQSIDVPHQGVKVAAFRLIVIFSWRFSLAREKLCDIACSLIEDENPVVRRAAFYFFNCSSVISFITNDVAEKVVIAARDTALQRDVLARRLAIRVLYTIVTTRSSNVDALNRLSSAARAAALEASMIQPEDDSESAALRADLHAAVL